LFVLIPLANAKDLPSGLQWSVIPSESTFSDGEKASVNITVVNSTAQDITFNPINTVLDIVLSEPFFSVKRGGTALPFREVHAKRTAESMNRQITIKAGNQITKEFPLAAYFDLSQAGVYAVSAANANSSLSGKRKLALGTDTFTLFNANALEGFNAKRTFGVRGCSASRVNDLELATRRAEILATVSYQDLINVQSEPARANAARTQRWFGRYSQANYAKFISTFENMSRSFADEQISYDCGCIAIPAADQNNVFAYVFPDQPFVINLCGAFWAAPLSGVDSRSGTIIHEMAHFDVVGAANDVFPEVYGTEGALALAILNPTHAVNNAENCGYFAENSPKFKMGPRDLKDNSCQFVDAGRVNPVTTPSEPISVLSRTVDTSAINIIGGGDRPFVITTLDSTSGGSSARSNRIGANQTSTMAAVVRGPGTIAFDWKVSSERGFDGLAFGILNANEQVVVSDQITGNVNWSRRSFSIPSGPHTLVWLYAKDGSVSVGQDAGWVDRVVISGSNISQPFTSSNTNQLDLECVVPKVVPVTPIFLLLEDE